jgi:hypothetical protein
MESNEMEKTHPIRTLSAPSGVTRIGGANVYAAKLATAIPQPNPEISIPSQNEQAKKVTNIRQEPL